MSLVPASIASLPELPVAHSIRFTAAGVSDRGRVRPSNQDCFRVDCDLGLMLVADGMGGHAGGDIASRMAAATLVECVQGDAGGEWNAARPEAHGDEWPFGFDTALSPTANRLRTGFHIAHLRLLEASLLDPTLTGMGTTLVVAVEQGDRLTVAWAGDSRLYVLDDQGFRQVTRDDSWLEAAADEMAAAGVEDAGEFEALRRHPLRHALTNVVGTTVPTVVHVRELPVTSGMVVLLTTDGVHGALAPDVLAHFMADPVAPADTAAALVGAAIAAGSTDNCTAVIARFTS